MPRRALLICSMLAMWFIAAMALPGAAMAHASAQPTRAVRTASVSPSEGLLDVGGDGQFVTITWSGFKPGSAIYMRECARNETDANKHCAQAGQYSSCSFSQVSPFPCPGIGFLGVSDRHGGGSGVAQIAVGALNTLASLDPIPGLTFRCDWSHPCSLFITDDVSNLAEAASVRVDFAKPPGACPEGGTELSGSGGAAGFRLFQFQIAPRVCKQDPAIQMRYLTTSAEAANATYAAGDAPFAVTSLPLTQKQSSDIALHGRTYGFAPVAASGLVLAYRLFDTQTYRQITTLTLTPDQLAGIFTGQIRSWYDPDILKLNPGVTPPPLIGVVGRGDACEETLTFTRWMWEHARKAWLQGGVAAGYSGPKNPYAAGPTDLLPATDRVALVTGARREASVVRVGEADYTSTATYGMIGYMDASWAAAYQLPTVRIKYPDGTISAATPATIEAALSSMHPDRDGLLQPDVSVVDADRWSMPTVSYMLLPRDAANSPAPPDGKTLRAVRDLLAYATTTAQKDLPDGYVPLTDELKALAANAVASVYDAKPLPTTDPPTGGQAPPPPPPPPQEPAAPTAAPTPVPTPTPTPSPDVVIVAAERAPVSEHVAASRSRLVLPGIGIVAAAAAGAGCFLLWKPAPAPGVSRRRPTVRRSR